MATPSHKDLPEATKSSMFTGSEAFGHGTRPAVPVVPVSHHTDEDRARGPGRKTETKDSAWEKTQGKKEVGTSSNSEASLELGYLEVRKNGYLTV